jgi:hypothetical protein
VKKLQPPKQEKKLSSNAKPLVPPGGYVDYSPPLDWNEDDRAKMADIIKERKATKKAP